MQIVESRVFNSVLQSEAAILFQPDGINLTDLTNSLFIKIDHAFVSVFDKAGDLNLFAPGTGQ